MSSTPVVVLDSTLTDIADAIRGKNGSSDTYKPSEMPAAITAIPSGGGEGIPREVNANGVYGFPTQNFTFSLPSDAIDVKERALYYAFYNCTSITSVDLSSLTKLTGREALYYAFYGCTSLTSVDASSLTIINNRDIFYYAFGGCTSLTSANFSSLVTIGGNSAFFYAFYGCTSLTSANFNSLTSITNQNAFNGVFYNCSSLTSVTFPLLANISYSGIFNSAFRGCTHLTSLSFPSLTSSSFGSYQNQFNGMLTGVTGCTVHFPADIQSTIGSWSDVTNGFGGTNTTVLFDL